MSRRPKGTTAVGDVVEAIVSDVEVSKAPQGEASSKRKASSRKGVSVYFTPEEKAALEAEAQKAGLSVASFIRSLVKGKLQI